MERAAVAGIDYSLTSPAITVHDGDEWKFSNCKFYYLTSAKKSLNNEGRLNGTLYPNHVSDQDRYNNIATWSLQILQENKVRRVSLEGYSFGSVGRVFQIAENTGYLKQKLWEEAIEFDVPPPTRIKKFATGKGNASKEMMEEAFLEQTGYNIRSHMNQTEKQWNPSSDIIDSYFMAMYCFNYED